MLVRWGRILVPFWLAGLAGVMFFTLLHFARFGFALKPGYDGAILAGYEPNVLVLWSELTMLPLLVLGALALGIWELLRGERRRGGQ